MATGVSLQARPQRSWLRRNWKWCLPASIVGLLSLAAIGGSIWLLVTSARKKATEPYQFALEQVKKSPKVIARLGEPIEDATKFPSMPTGDVEDKGDRSDATFRFQVSGPKGKAEVTTSARKIDGKWAANELEVVYSDGEKYNLKDDLEIEDDDTPKFNPNQKNGDGTIAPPPPNLDVNIDAPPLNVDIEGPKVE